MEGSARYPLDILPKEIWKMIILEVKNSEDVRNLMKASKQLNDVFNSISHMWLLDKVLPFLTSTKPTWKHKRYLKRGDVLKLRLVDKRWCEAVDAFLENQPSLRPYNKDDDKVNSEMHIWSGLRYHRGKNSATVGRVILQSQDDQLRKFSKSVETLKSFGKSTRNPFPSRSISSYPLEGRRENDDPSLWRELDQDVSLMLGKHVWFLKMRWIETLASPYQLDCKASSVWKWIIHSLKSLPNLKSLRLEVVKHMRSSVDKMEESEAKQFLQLGENQLPHSPFLESLIIYRLDLFSDLFSQQLMSKYCLQLRRIEIYTLAWEFSENLSFPNLTELCIGSMESKLKVTEILMSLEAPQLTKLRLGKPSHYVSMSMEDDIFPCVSRFPSLLYLDMSELSISESGTLSPPHDAKPSLKYLKIHNSHGVNFNFLRCLPSLQRLQIVVDDNLLVWDCSVKLEVKIKLEIETNSFYKSNVWDLCPKLERISTYSTGWLESSSSTYFEFDKTTYEKMKNKPEPELPNLRDDIIFFLDVVNFIQSR